MNDYPNISEKWAVLEGLSVGLGQALQQILETLKAPKPGGAGKEISVHLTINLSEGLPSTIKPPDRAKQVRPGPQRRVRAGGMIAKYPVVAVAEVVARIVVYGSLGEEAPTGMNRNTWYLPVALGLTPGGDIVLDNPRPFEGDGVEKP